MAVQRFRWLVVFGVVLTVATLVVGGPAGKVPECATGTILELEIARTEAKATELIGGCNPDELGELHDAMRFDNVVFAPMYVASTAFWCVLGSRRLRWSSDRRRRLVGVGASVIVVGGLFDLVENHYLNRVIDAAGASSAIGPATAASVVKWLLVFYAVPTAVVVLVRCLKATRRPDALVGSTEPTAR